MPDPIHLQLDRFGDVVTYQFETRMANPAHNIGFASSEVVVEADHFLASLHQAVNQMGAKEAGTSGNKVNPHIQEVISLSTIAATGASAMMNSSDC